MGRRRGGGGGFGGGRARAPPPRPATYSNAPPPAQQTQGGGGSVMGGLAGMVAQGAAWGTGTSIARAAVGSMMGGGGGHEAARPAEEPRQAAPSSNPCVNQMKLFSDCINQNSGEIAKCQIYLDMVQACKRGELA